MKNIITFFDLNPLFSILLCIGVLALALGELFPQEGTKGTQGTQGDGSGWACVACATNGTTAMVFEVSYDGTQFMKLVFCTSAQKQ